MDQAVNPPFVENTTFDEIRVGQRATLVRTLTDADIRAFAAVSGDTNPAHLDHHYAESTLFHGVIGHGMWGGALISAVLGTVFPGPGTIYIEQNLKFHRPVRVGDTVTVTLIVINTYPDKKHIELECLLSNQAGQRVMDGTARVLAPTKKLRLAPTEAPTIQLVDPQSRLRELLRQGQGMAPPRCAVVHPCDVESLRGAIQSAQHDLIVPVLIGPENKIRQVAEEHGLDLHGVEGVWVEHSHAAAQQAAEMAAQREVGMIMKGSLHTDELIHAVVTHKGLRTGRRMSHVFRFDVPAYSKPLLITDAALNIAPTLREKVDIVQNAVNFARLMGVSTPKVALLAAVETVNPDMPSTLDAAALCKMADRKQITGAVLDGPLAFDNAVSAHAAGIKQIESAVAGDADVLMVPDLESGNMLAKQLEYLAGAFGSGIVLGAKVPIALTSRADGLNARLGSALLAKLVSCKTATAV